MSNVLLWKAYRASGAVQEFHIVHPNNAAGDQVKVADTHADKVFGVSGRGDVASGGQVEVAHIGIADVRFGAAVVHGDLLKSSAAAGKHGRAIPATAADDRIIGVAMSNGADGDIGQVLLGFGQVK